MSRHQGAREIWRYLFTISALLLAIGIFANSVFAGIMANSPGQQALLASAPSSQANGIFRKFNALVSEGGADVCVSCPDGTYPRITQAETMVWGHGNTIVVAYNDSRGSSSCYAAYSYSTDGGATFTRPGGTGPSPICTGHGVSYGRPMVVFNERLSKWYLGGVASGCGGIGIGLWSSNDGITFIPAPCPHTGSQDSWPSIGVDNNPSSPYYGRMYLSWNDNNVGGGALRVTYADDGTTWSAPVTITPPSSILFRSVHNIVGQDGTVFIAVLNEGGGGLSRPRQNLMERSTDGGATWQQIIMGATYASPGVAQAGYTTLMYQMVWRYMGGGQPAVGPNRTVHYVYTQHGASSDPADMMYTRSTDNGSTWSTPMLLNTDTSGRRNWQGSLAATTNGTLMASWYDGREITTDCGAAGANVPCYRRWGRISRDNGATWEADFMIGDTISPLPLQPDTNAQGWDEGQYDHASADGDTIYTTWMDGRTFINNISQQDVYFDKIVAGPNITPTPTPCGTCNLDILVVTSSCNVDGTTHWIAVTHNPDPCAISAPWRAELQVRENSGNWRAVRIQYATTTFPHGDTVLDGTFCYRFSPNTQAVRVEFLFEDQEHASEGSNGNVQEREAAPNDNTIPGNGKPASRSGKTNPSTCDADMASPAMTPCIRIDPCN